jgi:amino acid transporter
MIFAQLLSQNLFPIILSVENLIVSPPKVYDPNSFMPPVFDAFSYQWTCIIIFVIVFCMTATRDVSIYVKINSVGVIFIIIVTLFICGLGIMALFNTEYIYGNKDNYFDYLQKNPTKEEREVNYKAYIGFAETTFPPLMGILGGGFYFHNISLPVIKNSKNPENNVRDVFLGYLAVFIVYCMVGTLGYYGFAGKKFKD